MRDPRLLVLAMTILLTACVTWRPQSLGAGGVLPDGVDLVRVMTTGGDTLALRDPILVGDTLYGLTEAGGLTTAHSIAVENVKAVLVKKPDYAAALPAGIAICAAVFTGGLYLLVYASGSGS